MSGFVATSGKYEVFAPGDDTAVLFNDNNDVNAVSSLTFTKGTATLTSSILSSPIFKTATDATSTAGATSSISAGVGNDISLYHNGTDSYILNTTGVLNIISDGTNATDIVIDAEGDDVVIKYSGTTGATFNGTGLDIAGGDSYSIGTTAVVSATGAALVQPAAITGRTELGSGAVVGASDMLVIADASDSFALKKVTPNNLGISGGGGGGSDALARALKTLGLVEIDAS